MPAASGIATPGEPAQLQQTRVCQIWAPTDSAALQQRQAVVTALAAELVRVFANLGVVIDPCQVTVGAADADLIVSAIGLGGGPSATVDLNLEGFLGQLVDPSTGARGLANGGGAGSPQPGLGANARLLTPDHASDGIPVAIGPSLAVALVLFSRSALDRSVPRAGAVSRIVPAATPVAISPAAHVRTLPIPRFAVPTAIVTVEEPRHAHLPHPGPRPT